MLELHDPNAHGFVGIPVILACREQGVFELLREPMTAFELASRLGANEGHLEVALRLLHQTDRFERNEGGEYCLTERAHFDELPSDILSLYEWDMSAYLTGMAQSSSSSEDGSSGIGSQSDTLLVILRKLRISGLQTRDSEFLSE